MPLVHKVTPAFQDNQVLLDGLVYGVHKVLLDGLDRKVRRVELVNKVDQELLE